MSEMAHPGQDHGHLMFVGSLDHFLIADRSTGLNDGRDAGRRGGI
jgi:hypothetical protein